MYQYKCKIIKVYDADTITGMVDLGFNIFHKVELRVLGIDTPELRTKNKKEKELGYIARDFVRFQVLKKELIIETEKKGKFGRWLANIYLSYNEHEKIKLQDILIEKGMALEYFGEKKDPEKMEKLIENYFK